MAIGFGIVGTGMIAKFHAMAIRDLPDATLVSCFNQNPAKAEAFAREYGCRFDVSLDAMLADPAIQVVTICTPSGSHRDPAIAAARAGKHVLVEKPLEITLDRCDAIIAACRSAGVLLGTIFPSRFAPVNLALKQAIDAGRFGRITLADTYVKWWRSQEYYDSGAWRGTWEFDGGGAYMNQAIHNVDLLLWLMGDVEQVCGLTATLAHERIEVEDVGTSIVKFKNGALGTLEATTSAFPGLLKRTEIHGVRGSAIIEQDNVLLWEFADAASDDASIRERFAKAAGGTGGAADPKAIAHTGHLAQFADFARAIQTGGQPAVDGSEGRRSVELILAIYESAGTGKRITLK
jgi:predicted dehydrogenase